MKDERIDELITMNPEVLVGKPIIRGTRIPVYLIAGFVETGMTPEEIVDDYPDLTIEEVIAATTFAKKIRKKVVAYITNGQRLLVFTHPLSPEAGIQVPAGTMQDVETPADAVLREAEEETGLADLEIVSFLGQRYFDRRPDGQGEIHHRHFFHLTCPGTPPEQWDWIEADPSDSSGPIPFSFYWVDLSGDIPKLAARQDELLHFLVADADTRTW
mgnify:CR=1 FL=1